jgi:hypothetical protein
MTDQTTAADVAQTEPEGPSDRDLSQLIERFANPIKSVCKSETEAYIMVSNHFNFARAAIALDRSRRAPVPPAEALAARPLLEHILSRLEMAGMLPDVQARINGWLQDNRPGQPVAVEPRGCPMPGACACVEPAPPTEGEVAELVEWLHNCANVRMDEGYERPAFKFARAAALLQHHQPPQPVPVSERLPEPEDCDAEGRCWWYGEGGDMVGWTLDAEGPSYYRAKYWLPAHALPIPPSENV